MRGKPCWAWLLCALIFVSGSPSATHTVSEVFSQTPQSRSAPFTGLPCPQTCHIKTVQRLRGGQTDEAIGPDLVVSFWEQLLPKLQKHVKSMQKATEKALEHGTAG
eukprot:508943-Rhodomonas_salina.1